jgi:hypothetical protein
MSLPKKKLLSNPPDKTGAAKPALRLGVAKPTKVGPYGQTKANLFLKHEMDEYDRAHPGPGLFDKISDGIKGLLKKLTKAP